VAAPQGLCLETATTIRRYTSSPRRSRSPPTSGRGEEAQALKREAGFRARRWVVERTHSWLNRFRRILVRWEKRADTYLAMLHLACGLITWRATDWEPPIGIGS
jgi:putative transposase